MELVSLAKNPVPSGATVGTFRGYDGAELRFARWDATRTPRRGTVCLFGGRTEFIEKYFEVIADLRRRGFAVATMDWRGQGGSQRMLPNPRKGHVRGFWEYERDLTRFMKDIVLPDCPPPFIGLAHSMGGSVLLRVATMPGLWFERIVLTAPMITIHEKSLGASVLNATLYAELGCLLGLSKAYVVGGSDKLETANPFEGNCLTSDLERWTRTKAILDLAPSLGLGSPTVGWLRAALRCCRRISHADYPARINVPLLLFAAGNDTVVSSRAVEDFAVKTKVASCILMPGSRHEILQENDSIRTRFWAAFDAYLGVDAKVA
jgi:lysophospholipase